MVSKIELEEYKTTVQNIINKYLPENEQFSVKDFSQEWLYYLTSLFLEKDPEKRKKIYKEIETKKKRAEEKFKQAERNFLKLYNEIILKKEEYDKLFNTIDAINTLSNDIHLDQKLDSDLSD